MPNTVTQFSLISATATDTQGNTSEFCENFYLTPGPLIISAQGYLPEKAGATSDAVINIWVTDPDGNYIGKDENGALHESIPPIPDATYIENIGDTINIPNPILGYYTVEVIPELGVPEGSTYGIGIQIDGSNVCYIIDDATIPSIGSTHSVDYSVEEGWHYINGDANRDGIINIKDITYIIKYKYKGGPAPEPESAGDADCNLIVNIKDITYLIKYKYKGGPPPCNVPE
jgi:hypothetical protein